MSQGSSPEQYLEYAQLFRGHSYGWGLFKNVGSGQMRPGRVGYFDNFGEWYWIKEIPNIELVEGQDPIDLDPLTTENVSWTRVNATVAASAEAVGIPATIEASFDFESRTAKSAVCIPQRVTNTRVNDPSTMYNWVINNAADLLRYHQYVINSYGIWIITKTFTTQMAFVAIKYARASGVLGGVKVEAAESARLDLSAAHWHGEMSHHSKRHHINSGEQSVIFTQGIRIVRMWRWRSGQLKEDKKPKKLNASRDFRQKKSKPADKSQRAGGKGSPSDDASGATQYALTLRKAKLKDSKGQEYGVEYELWGDTPDIFKLPDTEDYSSAADATYTQAATYSPGDPPYQYSSAGIPINDEGFEESFATMNLNKAGPYSTSSKDTYTQATIYTPSNSSYPDSVQDKTFCNYWYPDSSQGASTMTSLSSNQSYSDQTAANASYYSSNPSNSAQTAANKSYGRNEEGKANLEYEEIDKHELAEHWRDLYSY